MKLGTTATTILAFGTVFALSGCKKSVEREETKGLAETVRQKIIQIETDAIKGDKFVENAEVFAQIEDFADRSSGAKIEVLLMNSNDNQNYNLLITDNDPMGLGVEDSFSGIWDGEIVQYTIKLLGDKPKTEEQKDSEALHTWLYFKALESIRDKIDSVQEIADTNKENVEKENLVLENLGIKSEIQSKIRRKFGPDE